MTVTVVSCLYGDRGYQRFAPAWCEAIRELNRFPDDVIVAGDQPHELPAFVTHIVTPCTWWYPQAFYLQQAILAADTDWVVIADIDDTLMRDALDGLENVSADVWQMGFLRSDGETYIPPDVSRADILVGRNLLVGSSAIRTAAFRDCHGFADCALQDWALWRALARRGATFQSSGRAHFNYLRHPDTRGELELTAPYRPAHVREMQTLDY